MPTKSVVPTIGTGTPNTPTATMADAKMPPPPPDNVIEIWEEVGDKLSKSQRVSSKKLTEALENAKHYQASSNDAQQFTNKYLFLIIFSFLSRKPFELEKLEKANIKKSLQIAIKIVNEDLISKSNPANGNSSLLHVLASVFDQQYTYYEDPKATESIDSMDGKHGGLPEVRTSLISLFHQNKGFTNLANYLSLRTTDTCHFPSLQMIHLLLVAIFEVIFLKVRKGQCVDAVEQEAQHICDAVMKYLSGLDGVALASLSTDAITQVRTILQKIAKRLSMSNGQAYFNFHSFWRCLVSKLVYSHSLPHKQYGWKQIGELIDSSRAATSYVVSGAGCDFINGQYTITPSKIENGRVKPGTVVTYERTVPNNSSGSNMDGKKLILQPCLMQELGEHHCATWWFLSEAEDDDGGVDYYYHQSKPHEDAKPPTSGWSTGAYGVESPPKVEALSSSVSIGEGNRDLEQEVSKWIIDNKVFDAVLGEHSGFLSTVSSMTKFLGSTSKTNRANGSDTDSALKYVSECKTRMLETILPMLSEETIPAPFSHSTSHYVSSSLPSSDFFAAVESAKHRLACAERWRKSTENAIKEHMDAIKEVDSARSYLAQLEQSRQVIDVDFETIQQEDADIDRDKKPNIKRPRMSASV